MRGDSERFVDVGFDGYLAKPVDVVELIRVVESTAKAPEIQELRASRRRLALAAAAERRRIERELHDGLQQRLVALAVELQQARRLLDVHPAEAGVLIDEMSGELHEAVDALRALAHRIHPPLLEAGGVRAALRTTAAMLDVPTRVQVPDGTTLPPALAEAVYFSCADALEHLRRAAKIAITVRQEEETVVFEISAETADSGTALADLTPMRDRLEALGGRLTIEAKPGHTDITGSLPLSDEPSRSPSDKG
jgi:signal transduction histidine kinase